MLQQVARMNNLTTKHEENKFTTAIINGVLFKEKIRDLDLETLYSINHNRVDESCFRETLFDLIDELYGEEV